MTIATCPHLSHHRIIDRHEGTIICGNCALVLEDSLLIDKVYLPEREMVKENSQLFYIFRDLTDNFHLYPCIARKSVTIYQELPKKVTRTKKKRALIAYVLYRACIEEDAPRSIQEISRMCGISPKEIGIFESKCKTINSNLSVAFLSRFNIPLHENLRQKILRLVTLFSPFSAASPTSILCGAFYILQEKRFTLTENKRKVRNTAWLSLNKIRERTGICQATLHKTVKSMRVFLTSTNYKM